jgi:hypothetical protein
MLRHALDGFGALMSLSLRYDRERNQRPTSRFVGKPVQCIGAKFAASLPSAVD